MTSLQAPADVDQRWYREGPPGILEVIMPRDWLTLKDLTGGVVVFGFKVWKDSSSLGGGDDVAVDWSVLQQS